MDKVAVFILFPGVLLFLGFTYLQTQGTVLKEPKLPEPLEARILQKDEHFRGSASIDGGGNFLSWDVSGNASAVENAGRLSVVIPIKGVDRHMDIEVSRSRLLALRQQKTDTISLQRRYHPCHVDAVNDIRLCYQLTSDKTGAVLETTGQFETERVVLKTTVFTGPNDYHQGWWQHGSDGEMLFHGYLSEEKTAEILSEAYERHQ